MSKTTLEKDFDRAMMDIYHRAKSEAKYTPSLFHKMLSEHGGIETARRLIHLTNPSDGYTALWERGRLDLTVEAVICDDAQWHPLFSQDTLNIAKNRLEEYGYKQFS